MKHSCFFFMALVALVCLTTASHAAISYSGGVGDAINISSDPNTWTAATEGYIGIGSDGTVNVTPSSTLLSDTAYIGYNVGITGAVTVNGTGAAWTNTSGFYVGEYGTGTLAISNGGAVTAGTTVSVGNQAGSSGTLTLSDSGSSLGISGGDLWIGYSGTGSLNAGTGTTISSTKGRIAYQNGSTGTATVSGTWTMSSDFIIGCFGNADGSIEINGGAISNTNARIGAVSADAVGAVTVTGTGSTWTNSQHIYVGEYGTGTLNITAGAVVSNTSGHVGRRDGSTGTVLVSGSGSQWSNSDILYIARDGDAEGSMTISDGAVVTSTQGRIGYCGTTSGTVDVDGGTWNMTDDFFIGARDSSAGDLTIQGAGSVTNAVAAHIGYETGTSGSVTVTGADSTWTSSSWLQVGSYGTATLDILNGGVVSSTTGHVGRYSGGDGTTLVSGSGSQWNCSKKLYVAQEGDAVGSMTVSAGAVVTSAGIRVGYKGTTVGEVDINGGTWNSTDDIFVGAYDTSDGTLTVQGGGQLSTTSGGIAYDENSVGKITVTGSGSNWTSSEYVLIGRGGTATFEISDGATVSNTWTEIASLATSNATVTVTGTGSQWNNTSYIHVGNLGTGSLNISNGASVTCAGGNIGRHESSNGTITVKGMGSTWTSTAMFRVGHNGTGVLNINDGGKAIVTRDLYVDFAQTVDSSGTINFNGGTLTTSSLYTNFDNLTGTGTIHTDGLITNTNLTFDSTTGLTQTISGVGADSGVTIYIDASGDTPWSMGAGYDGAGSLTITDGVVLTTIEGDLAFHSTATANALVSGEGSAWMLEGSLDVGHLGAATLEITDGGLVAVSGILSIDRDIAEEIDGAVADSYINMSDGGMLALEVESGSLEELDPASLIYGSNDHLQWWSETLGDWAPISTATSSVDYTLEYITEGDLAGYALLIVGGEDDILGDANHDGKVDTDDSTIMVSNWLHSGCDWEDGDFNGDGIVNTDDSTLLVSNWLTGVTDIEGGVASDVPEPATTTLLVFLGLFVLCRLVCRKK